MCTFAIIVISLKTGKQQYKKTAILVAGPTAAGKTRLAIALAQHFQTEILSADSRQCFREMTIGTAVPSADELQAVPHHFIHSHSVIDKMDAGLYEQYALQVVATLFRKHNIIVVCGGTGLYLKAFAEGIDQIPPILPSVKKEIEARYQKEGIAWLQQQLQEKDKENYPMMEQQNPQRLMRALAVLESTGQSIKAFQTGTIQKRPFNVLKIGLSLPKEQLWKNIEKRSSDMIQTGLVEEARHLYDLRHLNALQTVGYKEMFAYLEKKYALDQALEQVIIHTRQYAKRQMTWFRKDNTIQWFLPKETTAIIHYIESQLENQPQ